MGWGPTGDAHPVLGRKLRRQLNRRLNHYRFQITIKVREYGSIAIPSALRHASDKAYGEAYD